MLESSVPVPIYPVYYTLITPHVQHAGLGPDSQPSRMTVESFNVIMRTNVLGPILVSQAFLPMLEAHSEKERLSVVINVSSIVGSITFEYGPMGEPFKPLQVAYAMSKASLNMLVRGVLLQGKGD